MFSNVWAAFHTVGVFVSFLIVLNSFSRVKHYFQTKIFVHKNDNIFIIGIIIIIENTWKTSHKYTFKQMLQARLENLTSSLSVDHI